MNKKEYFLELNGKKLSALFTDLADQANGSVLVKYGETVVFATAVMSANNKEELGYFPLVVDYEEKFYASGRILGGRFIKKEGRPSDEAVLTGRVVDRTIRPLFDQRMKREVQVVVTVLSFDGENDPDVPSAIAASLAIGTSNIPWNGPVSAVRVAKNKGEKELYLNPNYEKRTDPELDLLVCGKNGNINMIEAEAGEISEEDLSQALVYSSQEIKNIQNWQNEIITEIGKEKEQIEFPELPDEAKKLFAEKIEDKMLDGVFSGQPGKKTIGQLKKEWLDLIKEALPDEKNLADAYFEDQVDKLIHQQALEHEKRADGRPLNQVREIFAQAGGISEKVHGTGIFYRGQTHVLSMLTLGGPKDAQLIEGMETQTEKRFMHHYNFPPFSVGETGRIGGASRRSIGHGALAEKSLRAVIPSQEKFPYTIRLVSESMASNGSTSMGSVCGSSLALMDGGVPIKGHVAGIAMGLMQDLQNPDNYKILTDIQGPEDHFGDMDFKVAGTKEGITGIQLDIKVDGVPVKALSEALVCAKEARLKIIADMEKAIASPAANIKPGAPVIETINIPPEKIGTVIGPGGKTIQKVTAETGTEIEIEDSGLVFITGDKNGVQEAKSQIELMTHEFKIGEQTTGVVDTITDFGAFVNLNQHTSGLVHISEINDQHVEKVSDFLKEGQTVKVKIIKIDDRGKIGLSIKQADK